MVSTCQLQYVVIKASMQAALACLWRCWFDGLKAILVSVILCAQNIIKVCEKFVVRIIQLIQLQILYLTIFAVFFHTRHWFHSLACLWIKFQYFILSFWGYCSETYYTIFLNTTVIFICFGITTASYIIPQHYRYDQPCKVQFY